MSLQIVVDSQQSDPSQGRFVKPEIENWFIAPYGHGGGTLWTYASQFAEANWGEWHPVIPQTGHYEVFAFIPYDFATTSRATYTIVHRDGQHTVRLDQDAYYDEWVSLGSYNFEQGQSGYVRLTDVTGEPEIPPYKKVAFDAMKWVYRGEPQTVQPAPQPPSRAIRGIHGAAGCVAPPIEHWDFWIGELKAMGIRWYKLMDSGDPNDTGPRSTFAWALKLKQHGIEPIVRLHADRMFPDHLTDDYFGKVALYASHGIRWVELGNEPNLALEWKADEELTWDRPDGKYARIIVQNWLHDAEKAAAAGAWPAFYALAPTDWNGRANEKYSSAQFYERCFRLIAADPSWRSRFLDLFRNGAWLAVHVSTYEFKPSFIPFPLGMPAWDMCLRGYEVPLHLLQLHLGLTKVTVISTEGGVFCKDSSSMTGHNRLQSDEEHAQKTVEMFAYLERHSPPLQAMCPWLLCNSRTFIGHYDERWKNDGWYDERDGHLVPKPVVAAMKGG